MFQQLGLQLQFGVARVVPQSAHTKRVLASDLGGWDTRDCLDLLGDGRLCVLESLKSLLSPCALEWQEKGHAHSRFDKACRS
jgi:hypothetical protein